MKTAIIAMLLASASIASASAQDQTADYRMYSAEQMINRITDKYARFHNACDRIEVKAWNRGFSDECKTSVLKSYPILATIREIAMSGDEVMWAKIVDIVHKMEIGIEPAISQQK